MHVIAGKAVCFKEALSPEFKEYQKKIIENCAALADSLLKRGVNLVSGGTDNHLILLDLRSLKVTGRDAQHMLDEVNITCNKNGIPFDPEKPSVTSGIRLGTAAVTTRGMGVPEMDEIAGFIYDILTDFDGSKERVKAGVKALIDRFPLYE